MRNPRPLFVRRQVSGRPAVVRLRGRWRGHAAEAEPQGREGHRGGSQGQRWGIKTSTNEIAPSDLSAPLAASHGRKRHHLTTAPPRVLPRAPHAAVNAQEKAPEPDTPALLALLQTCCDHKLLTHRKQICDILVRSWRVYRVGWGAAAPQSGRPSRTRRPALRRARAPTADTARTRLPFVRLRNRPTGCVTSTMQFNIRQLTHLSAPRPNLHRSR